MRTKTTNIIFGFSNQLISSMFEHKSQFSVLFSLITSFYCSLLLGHAVLDIELSTASLSQSKEFKQREQWGTAQYYGWSNSGPFLSVTKYSFYFNPPTTSVLLNLSGEAKTFSYLLASPPYQLVSQDTNRGGEEESFACKSKVWKVSLCRLVSALLIFHLRYEHVCSTLPK